MLPDLLLRLSQLVSIPFSSHLLSTFLVAPPIYLPRSSPPLTRTRSIFHQLFPLPSQPHLTRRDHHSKRIEKLMSSSVLILFHDVLEFYLSILPATRSGWTTFVSCTFSTPSLSARRVHAPIFAGSSYRVNMHSTTNTADHFFYLWVLGFLRKKSLLLSWFLPLAWIRTFVHFHVVEKVKMNESSNSRQWKLSSLFFSPIRVDYNFPSFSPFQQRENEWKLWFTRKDKIYVDILFTPSYYLGIYRTSHWNHRTRNGAGIIILCLLRDHAIQYSVWIDFNDYLFRLLPSSIYDVKLNHHPISRCILPTGITCAHFLLPHSIPLGTLGIYCTWTPSSWRPSSCDNLFFRIDSLLFPP